MPCTARSATFTNVKCSPARPQCLDEALCTSPGPHPRHGGDGGFSLIELLIVIVVLGILATVVVFSVRGIVDRGEQSSQEIDERVLVTALENYYARHGVYATEAELVAAEFIRDESARHDITLTVDRSGYTISNQP
jgi:prepilin-type N-terminal cleavage/methylation domain-containing protein